MVRLDLYEQSAKNQIIRTLLALVIIVPCDILYLKLSEGKMTRLKEHFFAYFNVWITLAIVFGVSVLSTDQFKIDEVNNDTIKNYVLYGLLIGLLVYVPLYNWLISCVAITGFNNLLSLANTGFGIILSAFTCLMVFLISEKAGIMIDSK
jgi:uncharacterized membrane protein